MGPTVQWTGLSSGTPLTCWSPSAPRGERPLLERQDGLFLSDGIPSAATAYEYAKRWLTLAPEDPNAQKLVRDCEEYLEEEKALEIDQKEREEIIRRETPDDGKRVICK